MSPQAWLINFGPGVPFDSTIQLLAWRASKPNHWPGVPATQSPAWKAGNITSSEDNSVLLPAHLSWPGSRRRPDEDESLIRLVSNILPSLHGTSDSRGVYFDTCSNPNCTCTLCMHDCPARCALRCAVCLTVVCACAHNCPARHAPRCRVCLTVVWVSACETVVI